MKHPCFSIIIPAYNEEENIIPAIKSIENYFAGSDIYHEIIVVDDGSSDNTAGVAQKNFMEPHVRVIKKKVNSGKGAAVKEGVLNSKGHYILFIDADLSTPISELEKFIKYVKKGYDVVIGSRGLYDSQLIVRQPWYRESMGRIFNLFVKNFLLRGIKDTQCGFKLFRADCARKIFQLQRIKGFGFDMEALFLARKMGYEIVEVPVKWRNRSDSRVKIIQDSCKMFCDIFRILRNYKKGIYSDND